MEISFDMEVFDFENKKNNFETFAKDNGLHFWYARDLMEMLGYENYNSFLKSINKAMSVCASLNIPIEDNFISCKREINKKNESDYKLSRFACYLTSMNGDIKKPNVAKAQAYFITLAEAFQLYIQESNEIERVIVRDEITQHEKSLSGTAHKHGLVNYPFFQNAGYRGMYNMNLNKLKIIKGLDKDRSLLDFMGKDELAANLFRITQTELKIKNEGIKGQENLEMTAYNVGKKVRKTMQEISNIMPENLPIEDDIKGIQKEIKQTHKKLNKINKISDNKSDK